MSDLFEYLEAQAREDDGPFVNAASISVDRAERKFASFLSSAKGEKEFNSRINLVSDDIHKIAVSVCEEYGYGDPEHVANIVLGQLQMLADRNSDSSKTDSIGNIKREKLDSQDPSGYYTDPSPKLNPGSAGDNMHNTNPAIPELTPDESQSPTDASWPHDAEISGYSNLVDADKPMQPENHVGDSTMTFGPGNQADPVTASKKKSNLVDQDHAGEWEFPVQSMEAIQKRLQEGATMEDIQREFADFIQQNNLKLNDLYSINLDKRVGAVSDPNDPDALVEDAINEILDETNGEGEMIKSAAERMDFNRLSEMMTPSEAIDELVGEGMPQHEAKDRIDFYVNHINPGWASKHWTSANENMDQPEQQPAQPEQPAMPAEEAPAGQQSPTEEIRRGLRQPQNPMEELILKMGQSQWEIKKRQAIKKYKNYLFTESRLSQKEKQSLKNLDLVDQLDDHIAEHLGYNQEGIGVIGLVPDPQNPDGPPIPYIVEPFDKENKAYKNWIEEREINRSKPGAPAIGDKSIRNRSLGLPVEKGPGPFGGPTGL